MGGAATGDSWHDESVPRLLFARNLRPTVQRGVDCSVRLSVKRLPSDSTFRLVLQQLDYRELMRVFNSWAQQYIELEAGGGLAIDGKAIAGTLVEHQGSQQNFVSLVSLYCQQPGVVLTAQAFENQHQSELEVVQQLLEVLHLEGHIVTLDALHAKKNNCGILEQGNDFVIALKDNQGKLMQALLSIRLEQPPQQRCSTHEVSRNRHVIRVVRVYSG